ncbi:hypothetical protein DSO57_1015813 [Entomophthora muscae]|uniref:Uncharacterized protein n=1 Tax=Entomophthora muscae TaxID=34485 RepID=A0ACC2SU59_9FUNG|nr:hypothetical protein DSO57_1015813 [Entomophthora muscae]
MDDVPQPLPLGNQNPLLLTAPATMEVHTNGSPFNKAIQQSMIIMNNGVDDKGQQSKLLAIQHPSTEISMERFLNIILDLQTTKNVKDYIQHFAHPAVCHN